MQNIAKSIIIKMYSAMLLIQYYIKERYYVKKRANAYDQGIDAND